MKPVCQLKSWDLTFINNLCSVNIFQIDLHQKVNPIWTIKLRLHLLFQSQNVWKDTIKAKQTVWKIEIILSKDHCSSPWIITVHRIELKKIEKLTTNLSTYALGWKLKVRAHELAMIRYPQICPIFIKKFIKTLGFKRSDVALSF